MGVEGERRHGFIAVRKMRNEIWIEIVFSAASMDVQHAHLMALHELFEQDCSEPRQSGRSNDGIESEYISHRRVRSRL